MGEQGKEQQWKNTNLNPEEKTRLDVPEGLAFPAPHTAYVVVNDVVEQHAGQAINCCWYGFLFNLGIQNKLRRFISLTVMVMLTERPQCGAGICWIAL